MPETPLSQGLAMPAEWEKHEATLLAWPKNRETFPEDILPGVEKAYVEIVAALAAGEKVRILVDDEAERRRANALLPGVGNVEYLMIKTADVWVRDYGPIFVTGAVLAATKWVFNAWGDKYEDLKPDDDAGSRLAESTGLKVFRPGVVLEGGSVDVNGSGTLITTEQCLLNRNRNPGMDRGAIERYLGDYLGARKVVWLKEGIEGDDTDGHVDDVARFVGPNKVVCSTEGDTSDPNHSALSENKEILQRAVDQRGRKFEVTEIPMPRRFVSRFGRLPASYANFYIGNAAVLVPRFGCDEDDEALGILRALFRGRRVVGIDCSGLVHGLGTLHCVTQQVPAAP